VWSDDKENNVQKRAGVIGRLHRYATVAAFGTLCCLASAGAWAALLTLSPAQANVTNGQSVNVGLLISNLAGHGLGAFDVSIAYNPALLTPTGVVNFGPALGDPTLFDALTSIGGTPGLFEFAETSLLTTAQLAALQPASGFLLATIPFTAIGSGSAPFVIRNALLADAATGAAIAVQLPEPATLLLVSLAALSLVFTQLVSARRPSLESRPR
jgi:hypothetical protein